MKFAIYLLLAVASAATGYQTFQPIPPFHPLRPFRFLPLESYHVGPYRLCTYNIVDYAKCVQTVEEAQNNSIPLSLDCVRKEARENCIQSVAEGSSDMVVLTGHGYKAARQGGLQPVVFAREDSSSLMLAIAPRSISLLDLQEAPISMDESNHRSFHAAVFFNLKRGHDVCGIDKVSATPYIRIIDSVIYEPNEDEILICSNGFSAEFEDYERCNIEAGLQRAVFVKPMTSNRAILKIQKVFNTVLENFSANSISITGNAGFNFFGTFLEQDNSILKNNTIAFDLQPTYRNGVDENVFNNLHCNNDEQPHDPKSLL